MGFPTVFSHCIIPPVQPKETLSAETLVQTNVAGEILSPHSPSQVQDHREGATGGGRIPSKKIIIPVDATERLSESERPIVLPFAGIATA